MNSVWSNLDGRRKATVIGASLAVFAAILFLARSTATTDMSLLYAGLDNATAGEVITALDQSGVPYEVRGASIHVPTADRDRLRMTLAGQGLPANSAQGYELLDSLSGFGTTSQMFDAAYWRAKEGELARTMLASPHIRSARVHISATTAQPFRREQTPTAAVNVTTANGTLAPQQADALRFLVASAVPGLSPQDVAVIDGVGGLVTPADDPSGVGSAQDRVAELRTRVERLLAARVGPGNAVVEVSLETVTETESIMERRFDPDSRVVISTDVQESSTSSQDSGNGDVTVASNLPDGDAGGAPGSASSENSETRSMTNFEVSETQREILRGPGAIKRLTVAVLVNDVPSTDDAGQEILTPRPAEELEDLRLLVASAVGFDAERGDEITIRSMAFQELAIDGTEASDIPAASSPLDIMRLIQTAVLAAVALILGLFVVRPILAKGDPDRPLLDTSGLPPAPADLDNGLGAMGGFPEPAMPLAASPLAQAPMFDGNVSDMDEDPVERLRNLIEDRRDEAIQVLQSWIDEPDTGAAK